jgi:hypothetical protein
VAASSLVGTDAPITLTAVATQFGVWDTVSRITDRIVEEMTAWWSRPLESVYAAVFIDAVVVKMAPEFTLGQLQDCVEALAGRAVHTQNFRRLIEQQALVEDTGQVDTGGRPARLYRFRREVLQERHAAGTKLPTMRSR